MLRLILLITAALLPLLVDVTHAGEFEEGLDLFDGAAKAQAEGSAAAPGLFRSAAERWEALAASGTVSTRLYTNIGNARAFAGDLGEAVLAYRRALLIDPGNERARDSLRSLREGFGLEGEGDGASRGLLHALFFWHDALSMSVRRLLFGAFWVGGLLLVVLGRRRRRRRLAGGVLLAVAAALLLSLILSDHSAHDQTDAVLMVRTEGRTGDGDFYSPSHASPLPAGAELAILERRDAWVEARLRDGTRAWLPASALEEVVAEAVDPR